MITGSAENDISEETNGLRDFIGVNVHLVLAFFFFPLLNLKLIVLSQKKFLCFFSSFLSFSYTS